MGLSLFKISGGSCCGCNDKSYNMYTNKNSGNPNPYKFFIDKMERNKDNGSVVVMITYPDSNNYEGKKILVYDSYKKFQKLVKDQMIDPHFLKDSYSPIARFEPTEKGWELAIKLADFL